MSNKQVVMVNIRVSLVCRICINVYDSLIIENIIKPLGFSIVNEPSERDNDGTPFKITDIWYVFLLLPIC
ncbi:hypothetical protein EHRUM1_02460 [Ehrlichia ruminantium]|uniref:Uncharacterized protein n=1 Tax=Ehrlichia ruminantium (strain Welgevonden) TaxID=254945 RepID=A0A0H3M0V6_EHRRW|nr:hypothetical protein [Ehrlichia ruminantium]QLK52190.1 hypothetical protein FDZ65_01475 [Ehrlichia ruminantium]QLK54030.1 hypothetical protein FDZ63_01515 [Ehrlichia ruminantium]QLK54947.1 hypothetical protein FDZ62_01535 [Ehrlichia ruminantium]QLK56779.1 hypothetical protein FDZ60_01515 [Ehrlichia ruminantium]UOD99967.1 hypothetical protein IMW62_01540 [Ehrlichia ruminantium]